MRVLKNPANLHVAYLLSGLAATHHGMEQHTADKFKLEAYGIVTFVYEKWLYRLIAAMPLLFRYIRRGL